ncbi:ATP-binding cassette domain-containing protein [Streptomyces sp. NBC_00286]|uniref:ATP-binding cassette domain-containing protein n=1 Tax=Streptomyces sp. NBC_00286 TaxID=2975701 RepID=UPI002E284F83|nr:ATP-binding cassette domain-containing protein [Streptomyces sp. NBC_00286]
MLEIKGVSAQYGEARVLHEVSLRVGEGEVVTLVGRNGAGKTTLLRCAMGLHPHPTGTVRLAGQDITGSPAHRRARLGLGFVPDDRGIYGGLTVEENLTLPPVKGPSPWPLTRVYDTFPVLAARPAKPPRRQRTSTTSAPSLRQSAVSRRTSSQCSPAPYRPAWWMWPRRG